MSAGGDDSASGTHSNLMGVDDCGQAMCDKKYCASNLYDM